MAEAYSPKVAFAFFAISLAMRAKAGAVDRRDLAELEDRREILAPGDEQLEFACASFATAWGTTGLADAADALMDVAGAVQGMKEGHSADLEAALADAEFDWQRRADLR